MSALHLEGTGGFPSSRPKFPAGEKDRWGRLFDATKFRPMKDKIGRWINLKVGRKAKNKMENTPASESIAAAVEAPAENNISGAVPVFADVEKALESAPAPQVKTPAGVDPEEFQAELAAVAENPTAETAIGIIQTGLMLIGGEEGILSPVEKTLIRRPLIRVLAKYHVGKDVMPAEVDLVLAVLGLVASRLQKPKTAATWEKVKAWAVAKVFARKGAHTAAALRREVGDSVKAT